MRAVCCLLVVVFVLLAKSGFASPTHTHRDRPPRRALVLCAFLPWVAAEPLDRTQPLFRFYLVENFVGNKSKGALVTIIHHSIGDGTTLVSAFFSLTDGQLDASKGGKPPSGVAYKTKPKMQWNPLSVTSRVWTLLRDAVYGLSLPFGPYDTDTQFLLGDYRKLSNRRYCAFSQKISLDVSGMVGGGKKVQGHDV